MKHMFVLFLSLHPLPSRQTRCPSRSPLLLLFRAASLPFVRQRFRFRLPLLGRDRRLTWVASLRLKLIA